MIDKTLEVAAKGDTVGGIVEVIARVCQRVSASRSLIADGCLGPRHDEHWGRSRIEFGDRLRGGPPHRKPKQ